MKIAIIADTHLGYARFEEDSFVQAERAMADAAEKADVILFAGDLFDVKIPKLETLVAAMDVLKKPSEKGTPIYAIHGNHERRTKDTFNPVQLLHKAGLLQHIHVESKTFEKNEEKIQIFGMGAVPEEYAVTALESSMQKFTPEQDAFKILILHQTIKDLIPKGTDELTLDHLEGLPFDLIVNGHHHSRSSKLGGKFVIPGSTVITQLKKEETEQKCYYLYDTKEKKGEFIPINSRPFFYEELEFENTTEPEIRQKIQDTITRIHTNDDSAIISIKLKGSLKQGLQSSDISIGNYKNVYLDNKLNSDNLAIRLEKIRELRTEKLSVRDLALKELVSKTKDKISLFDPAELFEKLVEGSEETLEYLRSDKNGKTPISS